MYSVMLPITPLFEKRRAYDADFKRKARAAEPGPTRLALPAEFRAKTAADVLALLNEQLETLRQDASLGSVERAKGVGSLAGIALRAIEAGDTVARLEALESILKSRPKGCCESSSMKLLTLRSRKADNNASTSST